MIIFMIMIIGILGQLNQVEAALQANGAAGITANVSGLDVLYKKNARNRRRFRIKR